MENSFPAYQGDDPYIFVSYAHDDAELVFPEIIWLRGQGCNIWYDEGISPGSRWSEELAARLDGAALLLFFGTSNSAASRHCMDEIGFALDANKPAIAIHLEPSVLSPGMRLRLNSQQAILKFELSEKEYFAKLLSLVSDLKTAPASPTIVLAEKKSIAVLPFANMSNDADQEYFSDGISEDILNGLVNFSDLKVIARTSSFQFKGENRDIREIGKKLNVNHVLEGSVRKVGNRVRVTAQLIQVSDGSHLWSDRYDRELTDVFGVQDEVTEKILSALDVHLVTRALKKRERDIQAYQTYLLGLYHYYRSEFANATSYFVNAIDLDPEYEEPYVGLINTYLDYILVGKNLSENKAILGQYCMSLGAINPDHPTLQVILALQQFTGAREYQLAIDSFDKLIRQEPNDDNSLSRLVLVFNALGRIDLSLECQKRRVELDPLNPQALANLGHSMARSGRYDEARVFFEKSEAMGNPIAFYIGLLAVTTCDYDSLQIQVDRSNDDWKINPQWHANHKALCAYLKQDSKKLFEIINSGEMIVESFYEKWFLAALKGDIELAIDHFTMALETGEIMAFSEVQLQIEGSFIRKMFPEFCSHPRIQLMLRDFSLDEASIRKLEIPALPF